MEVIYKETIIDEIDKAIRDASLMGKKIEKINLSVEEWDRFVWQVVGHNTIYPNITSVSILEGEATYRGVLIRKKGGC